MRPGSKPAHPDPGDPEPDRWGVASADTDATPRCLRCEEGARAYPWRQYTSAVAESGFTPVCTTVSQVSVSSLRLSTVWVVKLLETSTPPEIAISPGSQSAWTLDPLFAGMVPENWPTRLTIGPSWDARTLFGASCGFG